jgi:hypothetical protein
MSVSSYSANGQCLRCPCSDAFSPVPPRPRRAAARLTTVGTVLPEEDAVSFAADNSEEVPRGVRLLRLEPEAVFFGGPSDRGAGLKERTLEPTIGYRVLSSRTRQ